MLSPKYSVKNLLKNSEDKNSYIVNVKQVLKKEKVREKQTIFEIANCSNANKTHKKRLTDYLTQIKKNILKLNFLIDSLNTENKISSLNVTKLTQTSFENKTFS